MYIIDLPLVNTGVLHLTDSLSLPLSHTTLVFSMLFSQCKTSAVASNVVLCVSLWLAVFTVLSYLMMGWVVDNILYCLFVSEFFHTHTDNEGFVSNIRTTTQQTKLSQGVARYVMIGVWCLFVSLIAHINPVSAALFSKLLSTNVCSFICCISFVLSISRSCVPHS